MILLYTAIGRVQLVQCFQFTISIFFFFLVRGSTLLVSHGRLGNKVNGSWGQFLVCQHLLSKTRSRVYTVFSEQSVPNIHPEITNKESTDAQLCPTYCRKNV